MFSVLVPLVLVIGCVAALAPRSLQSPRLLLRHVSSFARILPSDDYDEQDAQFLAFGGLEGVFLHLILEIFRTVAMEVGRQDIML